MAWKDLKNEIEGLFGQANDWEMTASRAYHKEGLTVSDGLYARIKRYLQTDKGKAALRRYQSQPHVQERRQYLEKLRRQASPERYRQYRRESDRRIQADPIRRERMLEKRRIRERAKRAARKAAV